MNKIHAWPKGHWGWPIQVTHKHGVRCGDMVWVGGQVDLSPDGRVLHDNNLGVQTERVIDHIARVLNEFNSGLEDLVNLTCFYVDDHSGSDRALRSFLENSLPDGTHTCITVVAVPYLAYPGMVVEIEAIAMRAADGSPLRREYYVPLDEAESSKFCQAVRCGKMVFISAQGPEDENGQIRHQGDIVAQTKLVMSRMQTALASFGASFEDVVKINRWYSGSVGIEDFEPASLTCASYFKEPGPAATGIPVPEHADRGVLIQIAAIAMIGEDGGSLPRIHVWPESLWDWHVHLPYKHGLRCGEMIFLGGQVSLDKSGRAVHPNDLSAQTHQAMAHVGTVLNELGAGYDDVCKVLTLYQGGCGEEALNANLPIRSSYFTEPGPATTGVPLPALAYEGMVIEIDIYAMVESDWVMR